MKRQIGRLLTPYSAYEACLFLFVFQHILFRLKLDLPLVSASSSTIPFENGLIPMLHNCRENSLEINQLSDNASSWSTKLTPDLDIPNPITSRRMPHTKTKIFLGKGLYMYIVWYIYMITMTPWKHHMQVMVYL